MPDPTYLLPTPIVIRYGSDLWTTTDTNHPLIDGVLWEKDVIMLLGSEKAGKSILSLQMAFCLTSGHAFLDKYTVYQPTPVLYLQTEGKPSEMVDRMTAMKAALDIDDTNFFHLYQRFFPLDVKEIVDALIIEIDKLPVKPKVIFVDSLYTSMLGDLSDNTDVRRLFSILSPLLERYNCAVVLIHHETKPSHDEKGNMMDKGDKASFGSVFLRAWVGHILYLKMHRDKSRTLSCDTQRCGKVLEREDLILVEPNPLCFEIKEDKTPSIAKLRIALEGRKEGGYSIEDLEKMTGLSRPSIERGLRVMAKDSITSHDGRKPRKYWICK